MKSRLPGTPLETLSISGALRTIVKIIHTAADISKRWKFPSKKAAGDFEDMSLMDKMYWGYKSKNPITRAEKGSNLESFFKNNDRSLPLPGNFETKHRLTIGAVGDLIKVEGLGNSGDTLYEDIADLIFNKDLSYANLESQLTGQNVGDYVFNEKDTPPLCCTKEEYDALKGHKGKQFTVMHTACNHTFDVGLEGLETTLAQLEKDNILDLGTNRTPQEQPKGRVIEKNGMKIGFVSAAYGLNGKAVPEGKEYMVNVVKFCRKDDADIDLTLLKTQIADCREQGCDVVIASLHWGYEYEFFPRKKQVETAHAIVEAGVDIILSHHSHVIQPVEYYRPHRDPSKTAIIAYSLGNLTSSYSAPHLVLSAILNLSVVKGTANGKEVTFVEEAEWFPVVQVDAMEKDRPVIRLERLETFAAREGISEKGNEYISAVRHYAEMVNGKKS